MKRRSQTTSEPPGSDALPAVELHTLDGLRSALDRLTRIYPERPAEARRHVIAARERAIWASRNSRAAAQKRILKEEMAQWMLVWLEDPSMFHAWAALRLAAMEEIKCNVCGGSGQCTECKGTGNGGQCFNCAGTGNCPQCQGTGRRKV